MTFFVGFHHPSDARHFDAAFISINAIRNRKSDFNVGDWIMDSGAFTEISTHGHYRNSPAEYTAQIERWKHCGNLLAAVTQDYMCEPFILERTGMTVAQHQELTIWRYDQIQALTTVYVMPVLQGYQPHEYAEHVRAYGDRLSPGMWVGVGGVCKRNNDPRRIAAVLRAILEVRPDLKLHGFGLKTTALADGEVYGMLHSSDSMAWSFAARQRKLHTGKGFGGNDHREALAFESKILGQERQLALRLTGP